VRGVEVRKGPAQWGRPFRFQPDARAAGATSRVPTGRAEPDTRRAAFGGPPLLSRVSIR